MGFTEPGLAADRLGLAPDRILSFSQTLYNYIIHVQTGNAAFMIGLGIAIIALAWFGIRRGESWALWTAFLSTLISLLIAVPLHYPFHFATLGHLGSIYLALALLLIGTVLSWRAMRMTAKGI